MKRLTMLGGGLAALLATVALATPAHAAPIWDVTGDHAPTTFQPGQTGVYTFFVSNVGDVAAPDVSLTIDLPPGVTTRLRQMPDVFFPPTGESSWVGDMTTSAGTWDCGTPVAGASSLSCSSVPEIEPIRPGTPHLGRLSVFVDVAGSASGSLAATATVSEGGGETVAHTETAPIGPPAQQYGIADGSFEADAFDARNAPERHAGAHPDRLTVAFGFNRRNVMEWIWGHSHNVFHQVPGPLGTARDVEVVAPRGLVGNPRAAAQCSPREVATSTCPTDSQVGTIEVMFASVQGPGAVPSAKVVPVYNLPAPNGALAAFGFHIDGRPVTILASLDPRDQSVVATVSNINESLPVHYQRLTLWGVPGDPAHDSERLIPDRSGRFGARFGAKPKPFLTLPSECDVPATTKLKSVSWQGAIFTAGDASLETTPQQVHGCDNLTSFQPSISLTPTTAKPDAPAGLTVDIDLPQDENPDGFGTPPLKDAVVTFPEGMTINPAAADGLQACTDAQLALGTDDPISCPEAAKIGTVTARTPVLEEPIEGSLLIRSQNSDDPASGEMFRMALVLEDEQRGLLVKLPGSVKADPATGRLTAVFKDNPQLPVSEISLRLKAGPRAPLATPATCGEKTFGSTLSSWAGQVSELTDGFAIPCPVSSVLSPTFKAGSADPRAGVFSPLVANIERADGQAYVNGLSVDLASGMLAKLKGVPVCGDGAAAAGSCAASSRVGTATVGAGSGAPFYLKGGVYLTGPYKGAPYGLVVKVRAAAGPFDLGDVIVRQALFVDRNDAHVTVVSDPLPTVVKGVPVRLRSIDVDIDRPGFTSTPTSCADKEIASTFSSPDGQTISLRSPYRVGECAALDLKPSLALSLSGKGQTTDGKHPAVTANVTQPAGQSNLKKVRVALPLSLALDPDNANGLCEFADGSKPEPTCPKASIVGTATAVTPILDQPLTGPVYFVKNIRKDPKSGREIRTLPKLVIPLTGQNGLRLNLTGTSNVEKDQLVTTFDNIPDAPVSSFKLNINGGKHGILVVSDADICKATQIADQQVDGQNGKQADADIAIQTPSCPLKVLSKKTGKTSLALKVSGLGAGKVTITGHGIKKTTKTITKSTVATITAKRTKGKPGKVTVSFDPAGPAKARKATK